MGAIKKGIMEWYVFLIPFVLITFVSALSLDFAVADDTSDGSGGEGISVPVTNETNKPKSDVPADTSAPCVDESLFKKLDKPLQSIVIFDSMDESFTGFYIRLKEKDTSCEFKRMLEQKNLKITYSPEKNLVYLTFTYENPAYKINEILGLSFVQAVSQDLVTVPPRSSQKLSIYINLNQNDNASQKWVIDGGINRSIYDQPGELGRILEEMGVVLHKYDSDLRSYYAEATPQVILEVGRLPFVQFIEPELIGSEASTEIAYIPAALNKTAVSENVTQQKEESVNKTMIELEEKTTEEKRNETLAIQKTTRKTSWFSEIISNVFGFLKSIFGRD